MRRKKQDHRGQTIPWGPDPESEVTPEGVGIPGFPLPLTPSDSLPAPAFVWIHQEAVWQLRG